MIISDLNHLEVVEQSTSVVGGILNVAGPQAVLGLLGQGSTANANSGGNSGINFGPATAVSINVGVAPQIVAG
jgi:hypothetical protein